MLLSFQNVTSRANADIPFVITFQVTRSGFADCVVILFYHYETPLRRRGNLMYTATYEIASVALLPRNDIVTQSLDPESNIFGALMGTSFTRRITLSHRTIKIVEDSYVSTSKGCKTARWL